MGGGRPSMKRQCSNCFFAELNVHPPDGGGEDEGANCHSSKHAASQDAMGEFHWWGFINLWRIEAMDDGAECPDWEQGNA
ncbi:hypothetical protein ACFLXL_02435 [Chloroflexota bacterium]